MRKIKRTFYRIHNFTLWYSRTQNGYLPNNKYLTLVYEAVFQENHWFIESKKKKKMTEPKE